MSTCKKTAAIIILILLFTPFSFAGDAGIKEVFTIQLTDLNGKDTWLPYIGEYPVFIAYEDFSNLGRNRELYLKTLEQPELRGRIKLIYISNTAPAWLTPDFLIYYLLREKKKQHPEVSFLVDRDRSLQKKWRLLDSDDKSVVILVNKNAEIIHLKYKTPDRQGIEKIITKLKEMIDL